MPIPTRIADQLRGKSFGSFDAFRKAFWKNVGSDPELSGQFTLTNRKRMLVGNAPKTRERDRSGKRGSFEFHHVLEVSRGGEVYGVENLRISTPKNHIDLHRGR